MTNDNELKQERKAIEKLIIKFKTLKPNQCTRVPCLILSPIQAGT